MPSGYKRETKTIDGVLYQKCTKCGEWLEATKENFYYTENRQYLHPQCKKCHYHITRNRIESNPQVKENIKHYMKEYYKEHREERRNDPKLKEYGRERYKRNKEKIKQQHKEYYNNNQDKIITYRIKYRAEHPNYDKKYHKKNKEKIKKYHESKALFTPFANKLTTEEEPIEGKNGELLVKCAYCGRYFQPLVNSIKSRISAINRLGYGECRLYCSDGCKNACPIFNQKEWPKGYKKASSREVDPLVRQLCLEAANYECQLCYKTIEETELHAHHEKSVRQNPILQNDLDNVITLCKKCHKKVHSKKGCRYIDLQCKN